MFLVGFFFQEEDGIRDLVRSRGLGDVYKRQKLCFDGGHEGGDLFGFANVAGAMNAGSALGLDFGCLLYTSDAADERSSVDLGGRRIIKKKKSAHCTGAADDLETTDNTTQLSARQHKHVQPREET